MIGQGSTATASRSSRPHSLTVCRCLVFTWAGMEINVANSPSGDSVVDRILRVFTAFPDGPGWLPLADLSRRAELPQSTAFRLVRQLAAHGLVEITPEGSVCLGLRLRLRELAIRNSPTMELRRAAVPFMEDIQEILNQNVNLAILEGREVLFVERMSRSGSVENRAGCGRAHARARLFGRAGTDVPSAQGCSGTVPFGPARIGRRPLQG